MAEITRSDGKVLAAVLVWAYRNGVEVTLTPRREHKDAWPVIRFRKGDRWLEQAFWPMTDLEGQAKHLWAEVALKLVVEEFDPDFCK